MHHLCEISNMKSKSKFTCLPYYKSRQHARNPQQISSCFKMHLLSHLKSGINTKSKSKFISPCIYLNPWSASIIYSKCIVYLNFVITVPGDALAPKSVRGFSSQCWLKNYTFPSKVLWLSMIFYPLHHIKAVTKWPPFRRWHFQTHFLYWNLLYFH